jgi:hypothetical protein
VDKENLESRNISIGGQIEIGSNKQHYPFFSGQITDVNVWDQSLSTNKIQDFGLNCNDQLFQHSPPSLINWHNATMKNHSGSISSFNITREETCLWTDDQIWLFSLLIFFEKAFSLCHNIGGKFYLPQNETELQKLIFQSNNTGLKLL